MLENIDFTKLETWLPLIIFSLKTVEICVNSIRVIATAKGYRNIAVVLSILECIVWISALSTIFSNLDNIGNIIFYVLGMATGNFLGIIIEKKLALGDVLIRVITQKDASKLLIHLREKGFRVTEVMAESNHGKVSILFAPIKKNHLNEFIKILKNFNPLAFYTVEEIVTSSTKIGKEAIFKVNPSIN